MRPNDCLLALVSILSIMVYAVVAQTGSSDARSAAGGTGTTGGGPTGGIPGGPGSPTSPNTLWSTGTSNGGVGTHDSSEAARSPASFSFLMPANTILVPGILARHAETA
jgi:hypothetical protein